MNIAARLEALRKELLDLGLRNPQLNFGKPKNSIGIVDEKTVEVFRILVTDGKSMSFVASHQPEDAEEVETELLQLPELESDEKGNTAPADRHTDTKLQTNLAPESLAKRLLRMHALAKTSIEETGANTLFIAMGFLEWYESESSNIPHLAPLLAIPVDLKRSGARERFKAEWSGEDLNENRSLREKLKNSFGINLPDFPTETTVEPSSYLDAVEKTIRRQPRWKVHREEMHLCFLSFGKFMMYMDLDPARWSSQEGCGNGTIVPDLLGNGAIKASSSIPDDSYLDDHIEPESVHCITEADSSQMRAIIDASNGRSFVIQGPPGTGKSQTITNIIADSVARGKTVLFVSEKMAALEVVKSRLDKAELGHAILELHSHKSTKKAVLESIQTAISNSTVPFRDNTSSIDRLRQSRSLLTEYARAANLPDEKSGIRPVDSYGQIVRLRTLYPGKTRFQFDPMRDWDAHTYQKARDKVAALARFITENGLPAENPFWGSKLEFLGPNESSRISEILGRVLKACESARAISIELAAKLQLPEAPDLTSARLLCKAASRVGSAPRSAMSVSIKRSEWEERKSELEQLLEAGAKLSQLLRNNSDNVIDAAWSADVLKTRQHIAAHGDKWWRFASSAYRNATAHLKGICKAVPHQYQDKLALLDAILESQRYRATYERHAALGESLFAVQWQEIQSDWDTLYQIRSWVFSIHSEVSDGTLPSGIIDFLSGKPTLNGLPELAETTLAEISSLESAWAELREALCFDSNHIHDQSFDSIYRTATTCLNGIASLRSAINFNVARKDLNAANLDFVSDLASAWNDTGTAFLDCFELSWFEGQLDLAFRRHPVLHNFDRANHEHHRDNFVALDKQLQAFAIEQVKAAANTRLMNDLYQDEFVFLNAELRKKKGFASIRRMMSSAGNAIQLAKPVFMMSPMSIAMFLSDGRISFDMVIFDEASQVTPADAMGGLLRAKQAIVVGDSKQMPPSSFFNTILNSTPDGVDDGTAVSIESILGLFESKVDARQSGQRMLMWHYRSRHPSLIAWSNTEFYQNRLILFPASGANKEATGLTFHHLPETRYDRGASRTNREEAAYIAKKVLRHAETTPHLSLGVVAFGMQQREAIEIELEKLRRLNSRYEQFFNENANEAFFIKNLENVQGDERDVIFISVGYGRDANGNLNLNFGPLNASGGERRLNVLASRARFQCHVFANFTDDNIAQDASKSDGVRALRRFIGYARTGRMPLSEATGKEPDSEFEVQVIERLRKAGHQVEPQVGTAGYFIDIGLRDPEYPGRFLLGIECDGAMYHSALCARDRDRLRQSVLEGLGWRIHRIWSTDWFQDPETTYLRIEAAIAQALLFRETTATPSENTIQEEALLKESSDFAMHDSDASQATAIGTLSLQHDEPLAGISPYVHATIEVSTGLQVHDIPPRLMADYVLKVVEVESPVHIAEVQVRIAYSSGVKRTGNRIREAVLNGINRATKDQRLVRKGDFLWLPSMQHAIVRDRSSFPPQDKKIELVPPEEIQQALLMAIRTGDSHMQEQ